MKKQLYISSAFAILFGMAVKAQTKDKNIGTEEVRVVKAYEATVVDAFKIKDNPEIGDEDNVKQEIKYTIYSFPVASTFSPEKGQAAAVDKDSLNPIFNNYALLGYGNYNTIQGELGIVEKLNKDLYIAGILNHKSSQGGITGVLVDDNYAKSNLDFLLGSRKKNNGWNLNFGVSQSNYNWYGLPSSVFTFVPEDYKGRDFGQKYNNLYLGLNYNSNKGVFEGGTFKYKRFWDAFDSVEDHLLVMPKFSFKLEQAILNVDLKVDYVSAKYANLSIDDISNKNDALVVAVEPKVKFFDKNYSVELGVGLANLTGKHSGEKEDSFMVYPKIRANFDLVKNIVIAYAGAEGGVNNNTYANFVSQNPFVSPDLKLLPTQQQFDFYVGMKGKLDHNISYNVKASYISEDNKAMFVNNPIAIELSKSQVYQFGNSFGVTYDLVKTFNAFGELNLKFSDIISLDLSGEYNSYSAKNHSVYNLPKSKLNAKLNVDLTDQWLAGVDLFFVGKRDDLGYNKEIDFNGNTIFNRQEITLNSYVDLNINLAYKAADNWTIFAKVNNVFNQSYQSWSNYKVQGTQILAGAMYKFNFKK